MTRPVQIQFIYLFIYLYPYSYVVILDFFCILEVSDLVQSFTAAPSECQAKSN